MTNLIQCSKMEFKFVHRQAFIISILAMLLQVFAGKFGINVVVRGEEAPLIRPHLPVDVCMLPLYRGCPFGTLKGV